MSLFEEAGIELPEEPPVMAATAWGDNSRMILDLVRLGYLSDTSRVLDPTYQDGTWWKHWRPADLTTNSLDPANGADLCFDFRAMPFPDSTFDVVAYDPPYVSKGGRKTSTIGDHQRRYGLVDAPKSPSELQRLINDGLTESARVARQYVLAKCQDYVSSGKVWWGSDYTRDHALSIGLQPVDRVYFLNNGSAQPERDRKCSECNGKGGTYTLADPINCPECNGTGRVKSKQQHARVNVSTLWVFRRTF